MPVALMADAIDLPSAVTSALGIVTSVFTFMFSNPICLILIGFSLIPIGFSIFKSMRQSASH